MKNKYCNCILKINNLIIESQNFIDNELLNIIQKFNENYPNDKIELNEYKNCFIITKTENSMLIYVYQKQIIGNINKLNNKIITLLQEYLEFIDQINNIVKNIIDV